MKRKLKFILIFVIFSYSSFSQIAVINKIILHSDIKAFIHGNDTVDIKFGNKIQYPIIDSGDSTVSNKINKLIRYLLFKDTNNISISTEKAIKKYIKDGLKNLDYFVSFNNAGILSITLRYEQCNYSSINIYEFLNFNLYTGELLTFNDIIEQDSFEKFINIVKKEKDKNINSYKDDINNQKDVKIDNTISQAIDDIMENNKSILFDKFQIKENKIIILYQFDWGPSLRKFMLSNWNSFVLNDYSIIKKDIKLKIKLN